MKAAVVVEVDKVACKSKRIAPFRPGGGRWGIWVHEGGWGSRDESSLVMHKV